jgi:hypothetical protein
MQLNKMFKNVLDYTLEALTIKVEEDSVKRTDRIMQSMSKIDVPLKQKSSAVRLSDVEKGILKALGLSMKDVKALKGAIE